jgi:hypothetical protein
MSEKQSWNDQVDAIRRQLELSTSLIAQYIAILTVTVAVTFVLYFLYNVVTQDHKQDYCHIEVNVGVHELWAHRPWYPAIKIGTFTSIEDAIAASKKLNCPIGNSEVK